MSCSAIWLCQGRPVGKGVRMDKGERIIGRVIKATFVIITMGILIFFAWGEFNYPRETDERNTDCREYADGWYTQTEDGAKLNIEVPGNYKADDNNTFIAKNVLPAEVDDDDWLCFRTAKQDVEIYVGDELRKVYTTDGKRPFGTFSVSLYVFVDLEPQDAGKTVTFKAWSSDDSRAGVMRTVHYGDRFAIWLHLLMVCGVEIILITFMLLVGAASVIIIGVVNVRYKKHIEMEYLCWGVLLIAIWLIGRCDVRQLFFPNVTIANSMTYFTIMIAPVPFLIYVDDLQKHRYRKMHMVVAVVDIMIFVFCTILQMTGTRDLMDMSLLIFVGIAMALGVIVITFVLDWRKGYLKSYRLVAVGFLGLVVAVLIQMVSFYDVSQISKGTAIAAGVVFLLLMATIKSITDLFKLERQRQDAVIASEAKAKFLARISHEIRTPINAVLGMDEMILRESTQNNVTEYAMDIRSAGKTLLSLVNDVLDMSKIESGKMEIIPSDYEVYKLIDNCYNLVAINIEEKGLELEVVVDETVPSVLHGDEIRIRQVIINLLTNAVKYTKEGKITFKVGYRELDSDNIMLSIMVSDTGIGITKESQEILFDAFERFDDDNTKHIEGSGLGLNIVKQLIELMGGTISVHSEYGIGSVFTVFLPQLVVNSEPMGAYEPEQVTDVSRYEYKEMFTAPGAKVLVVDDVDVNIKVFKGLLKSTGVNVDAATNGAACLELVRKKRYDIIFLDHIMPEMDGIQVLEQMKQMKNSPNEHTPVIMLTANALTGAREEYARCGFDDYITKPLRHIELEHIMVKYLPQHKLFGYSINTTDINDSISVIEEKKLADVKLEDFDFLNTDSGLAYCCNDSGFYFEMIKMFAYGDKIDIIREHYKKDDWPNYRLQIHSLKSTALTIGATEVSKQAAKIEAAIKQEDYMYVHRHHKEMVAAYEELISRIKNVFDR